MQIGNWDCGCDERKRKLMAAVRGEVGSGFWITIGVLGALFVVGFVVKVLT